MSDLVSAVVPLYKNHPYISDCIESINAQTYENIEIIFVDSGENSWVQNETEFKTTYIAQPPDGPARARNEGIENASGEYIAFLDSDDVWKPERIRKQIKYTKDYNFIYSDQIVRNGRHRVYQSSIDLGENPSIEFFRVGHGIPIRTVLASSDILQKERFNENLSAREDPHLWTRILRHADHKRLDEALAIKRKRKDSLTSDSQFMYEEEMKEIYHLLSNFGEYEQFKHERLYEANFRRAKGELSRGNKKMARKYLKKAVEHGNPDIRYIACTAAAMLPIGNRTAFSGLQKIQGMMP